MRRAGIDRVVLVLMGLVLVQPEAYAQAKKKDAKPADAPAKSSQVPAEPATTQAAYGDWLLTCQRAEAAPTPKQCEVAHSVVARGQQGPIMQIALGPTKGAERPLTVVVPTSVSFPSSVKVAVGSDDAKPLELTYTRCLPMGCFASANLGAGEVETWRAAQTGNATFVDGAGRTLTVPFSLRGLPQALDALAKE